MLVKLAMIDRIIEQKEGDLMARAVFYGAISLDGYLADKADRLDWLYQQEGGELVPYDDSVKYFV